MLKPSLAVALLLTACSFEVEGTFDETEGTTGEFSSASGFDTDFHHNHGNASGNATGVGDGGETGEDGGGVDLPSGPGDAIITDIEDTYVAALQPNTNFGESASLSVQNSDLGGGSFQTFRLLIKPNQLEQIPDDATITAATLHIHAVSNRFTDVDVSQVLEDWDEQTVTWNTQPAFAGAPVASFLPLAGENVIDIRSVVQLWVGGDENFGLVFTTGVAPGNGSDYVSSEALLNVPQFEITWE